ncbi:MerR family transcriptional regulator [Ectopseudomonas mendocina]|uniref:MerR family transcriptional regulator n=1 Tax=Ectopseudomonas mendocina TaxID=300 RepID=A0ABZ2RD59_ECTME
MSTDDRRVDAVQADTDLVPIREVARLTGVNPVTLRAWERRYGLIRPHRTGKGHRLYNQHHIEQIQQVLAWLARGVAVSQVRGLLEHPLPASVAGDAWNEERRLWLNCIEQLAERSLDDSFNRSLALYPAETMCLHLLLPLLDELQQRWSLLASEQLERVFFLSWLRSKLETRIYHGNCLHSGPPLLLLSLSNQPMQPTLWLCAWLASTSGSPVRVFDQPISPAEISRAISLIAPRAVLFHSDHCVAPAYLRLVANTHAHPQMLCGMAATIHNEALSGCPHLHLAESPLNALHCLQRLGLITHC